jgi:hypothetical protein
MRLSAAFRVVVVSAGSPPLLGDGGVDGHDPLGETFLQFGEPAGEQSCLGRISAAQQFNAPADLSERHHAQVKVDVLDRSGPRTHHQITAATDLQDVGVE